MNYKPMNGVGYQPMTPLEHERERVDIAQQMQSSPCLAVSLEFFDEMLCCLPPAYFGATDDIGLFSIMQVGEASDYNKKGQPVYETFMKMNNEAIEANLVDSRMVIGQWYFMGQQTLFIKK